jgi:RNA polymerase sigma factor (sigma-70 family)
MISREPKKLRVVGKREIADFRELFETHYESVFGWLSYLLGDTAAAEDLAQETFLKLLYSPPKERINIGGWLNTVAANLAFNYLKSEKNRQKRETLSGALRHIAETSAEDQVIGTARFSRVQGALEQLTARERLCLLLRTAGFRYEEIGEVIGVKASSIGSVLARARAKFIRIYGDDKRGGEKGVLR